MKKVLLISAPTIATKMLSKQIVDAADGQIEMAVLPESVARDRVAEFDILLLSPGLRFLLDRPDRINMPENMPVAVLDSRHFGDINGEEIYAQIREIYSNLS